MDDPIDISKRLIQKTCRWKLVIILAIQSLSCTCALSFSWLPLTIYCLAQEADHVSEEPVFCVFNRECSLCAFLCVIFPDVLDTDFLENVNKDDLRVTN